MKAIFSIIDPIHGLMQFNKEESILINQIIKTKEFQRLRHIKQLGMAYYIYPGANHNRFSHSFGAAYLSKRILQKLLADPDSSLEKNITLYGITAGLLHDIGHGPYSHLFEKITYGDFKIDHEIMTGLIIKRIIKQVSADNKKILTDISSLYVKDEKGVKIEPINNFNNLTLVKNLISSQLDADRMDYLLRDSHFCGVDYGNYDKKWLIHGIQYCKKEENHIIAVDRKAIGVIEHFLMARRLMTNCVYRHKKVVATEHFVCSLIEEIYKHLDFFNERNDFNSLPIIKFLNSVKLHQNYEGIIDDFLHITDADLEQIIMLIALEKIDPSSSFKNLADRLYSRDLPSVFEIDYSRNDEAEIIIEAWKNKNTDIMDWQVNLNPRKFSTYKNKDKLEKIYIIDSNKNFKSIEHLSLPIFSFTDKDEINPILIIDHFIKSKPSVKKLLNTLNSKCCFTDCFDIPEI